MCFVLFSKTISRDFNASHREFKNLAVKDVPTAGLGLGGRKQSHADVLCFRLCPRILLFLEQQHWFSVTFACAFFLVFVCVSVCANMRLTRFATNSLVSGLGRILCLCCVKIYEDVCV